MTNPMAETSPSTRGRILAALYLFVVMAYGYLISAFVELAWTRTRRRPAPEADRPTESPAQELRPNA